MVTKSGIFPKQIVSTKNACFFAFRKEIVFCKFSQKWHVDKNNCSHPPQNTNFLGVFWSSYFLPFFNIFSFAFFNLNQKPKMTFVRKPFFWHPDNLQKIFPHPTHLFAIFEMHYEIGGKQAKQIVDQILMQHLDQFWLRNPQNWKIVLCEVVIWAKFGLFMGYFLGQVGVIIWAKVILAIFIAVSSDFCTLSYHFVFFWPPASRQSSKNCVFKNCVPKAVLVQISLFWV